MVFFGGLLGLFLNGEYIKADRRYAGLNRDTHSRERDFWALGISRGCCGLSSYSMVVPSAEGGLMIFTQVVESKVMFPRGKSDRVSQDLASVFASIEM